MFIPIQQVLGMLFSMAMLSALNTSQAVATTAASAMATGLAAGGAAGAAAALAASRPNVALQALNFVRRVAYSPVYYIGGHHIADRRLRTLELAQATLAEAQRSFLDEIKSKKLTCDGLSIQLSDEYVEKIKQCFESGVGHIQLENPNVPSFFTNATFTDPFQETYTILILNEKATELLVITCAVVAGVSCIAILITLFRRSIRYSMRAYKNIRGVLNEEIAKENQKNLQKQALQTLQNPNVISTSNS